MKRNSRFHRDEPDTWRMGEAAGRPKPADSDAGRPFVPPPKSTTNTACSPVNGRCNNVLYFSPSSQARMTFVNCMLVEFDGPAAGG